MGTANSQLYVPVIKDVTETEWAYLAGVMDGDGSIMIHRNSSLARTRKYTDGWRRQYIMIISSVSVDFLNKLHNIVKLGKVRVYSFNDKRFDGKDGVYHCRYQRSLRFEANEMRAILPRIIPYLVLKKDIAEIVLKSMKVVEEMNWGEERSKKLKEIDVEFRTVFLSSRGYLPHKNSTSYWNKKRAEKGRPPVTTLFE
jgi:hypothetical protein